MHPNEMKNSALFAALRAEKDGFTATAEAFRFLAEICAVEARQLMGKSTFTEPSVERYSPSGVAIALSPAYSPNTRFQSARERVGDGFDLFCGFGTASRDGSGVIQAADG